VAAKMPEISNVKQSKFAETTVVQARLLEYAQYFDNDLTA
jgi:hypothetical protein